jgi:phosphotransferase system HPr (HPr) family protein
MYHKQCSLTVLDAKGIHFRNAYALNEISSKYDIKITLSKENSIAVSVENAMQLILLLIKHKDSVDINLTGNNMFPVSTGMNRPV